ncbi:MAG: hypothetical protein H5T98_10125 [Syntrophomonadaceae bacterium]|nr:hypothetical protein [Syntrophomonadaceae bacterium]
MNSGKKAAPRTIGLKLVSIAMAVLLWLYVVNQGKLTARGNVAETELEYRHLAEGLSVEGPDTVSVKLWGVFQETGDIIAWVDLSGLTEGTYQLPVNVKPVKGAMFTSVKPNKVEVMLEKTKEYMFPVKCEISRNPSEGYELLDIVTTPDRCTITGERSAVERVAAVVCPVDLGDIRDTSSFTAKLLARDANGSLISENIKIIPDTAVVYAAVVPEKEFKKVPVIPATRGDPEEGYSLVQVSVYPETVSILGNSIRLASVEQLSTEEIDITAKKYPFSLEVNVVQPEGLKVYPSRVVVDVDIRQTSENEVEQ